ncbi:MAG TPA: 3'-5' exonuclease, partial [Spirochaetia bacterium]|nr:3'-5' exonuclease [Spirochaetia bacterium]
AALIDEFQDTDPLQYEIFRRIYAGGNGLLYLIGDPKQAIYSFRGADIYAYLEAAAEADRTYTLEKNWRADAGLIRGLNTLFAKTPNPFLFPQIQYRPAESADPEGIEADGAEAEEKSAPLQIWFVARPPEHKKPLSKEQAGDRIMDAVAREVSRLLERDGGETLPAGCRGLDARDIAILVRTNRQAREMQQRLKAFGIPGIIHGTESLFSTGEASELRRILLAMGDPANERYLRTALASCLFGLTGEELYNLFNDQLEWERRCRQFIAYHELWQKHGFMRMMQVFLSDQDVGSRLLSFPDGERQLTNFLHLVEVLHQIALDEGLGVSGLIKWFERAVGEESESNGASNRPVGARTEEQMRLETDEPAVRIVTIHRSKGLQYPVTFCPFLWDVPKQATGEKAFHDENDRLTLAFDAETWEENRWKAAWEDLAESLRLLYVALTRAKSRCYVAWGNINMAERSAIAYLLHPNTEGERVKAEAPILSKSAFLTDREIVDELRDLERKAEGGICVTTLPESGESSPVTVPGAGPGGKTTTVDGYPPGRVGPPDGSALSFREFKGRIIRDWRLTSFSALTSGRQERPGIEMPDHDELLAGYTRQTEEPGEGIFAFPRGSRAGVFFHALFESLDFREREPARLKGLVADTLAAFGFEGLWEPVILDAVRRVLSLPLDGDRLQLSEIEKRRTLREMEFLFPLARIEPEGMGALFSAIPGTPEPGEGSHLSAKLEGLGFQPVRGFLKGFIDLVFVYEGRYYLADWKSNYLGPSIQDYDRDRISRVMEEEYYFLQYHLYALALHRYLSHTLGQYDYERHFGGVYYLFLRGIDPVSGSGYGLFHDRPSEQLIWKLDRYFSGEPL